MKRAAVFLCLALVALALVPTEAQRRWRVSTTRTSNLPATTTTTNNGGTTTGSTTGTTGTTGSTVSTSTTTTTTQTTTVANLGLSLYDYLSGQPQFSTLVRIIDSLGASTVADYKNINKRWTHFLPNENAWAVYTAATGEVNVWLLPTARKRALLDYLVVNNQLIYSRNLVDGQRITTAGGRTATVNNQFGLGIKSDGTYANSVFVNPIDVQVNANCVVHAINYPMVPEGSTNNVANNPVPLPNPASGSVPALLARNGRLSRSLALYQRFLPSWSSREIQQGTQIGMFFVTVDDGYDRFFAGKPYDQFSLSNDRLTALAQHSVVFGYAPASLTNNERLATQLAGKFIDVRIVNGRIRIQSSGTTTLSECTGPTQAGFAYLYECTEVLVPSGNGF